MITNQYSPNFKGDRELKFFRDGLNAALKGDVGLIRSIHRSGDLNNLSSAEAETERTLATRVLKDPDLLPGQKRELKSIFNSVGLNIQA